MTGHERQSIFLTERQSQRCSLSAEDVDFLLANHRPHLELRPTRRRNLYHVKPRGFTGVLITPNARISIRPKIPLANLCYLIDGNWREEVQEDQIELTSGNGLMDFLSLRLARMIKERAKNGLHRDYVERKERTAVIQGAVDLTAQMRSQPGRKDTIACSFQEFTSDIPVNQIPKTTLEWLIRSGLISGDTRTQLQSSLGAFQEVSSLPVPLAVFDSLNSNCQMENYRSLLHLCRLLVESLTSSDQAGEAEYPGFLLNLERVFEDYCTRQIQQFFQAEKFRESYQVLAQETFLPNIPFSKLPEFSIRPDLCIKNRGQLRLLIDMKWKSSPFVRADLYQILSYCAVLGCTRGLLIYPGSRARGWKYSFPEGGITIWIKQLPVEGPLSLCQQSMHAFLEKLRNLCD